MKELLVPTWAQFREMLGRFASQPLAKRRNWMFRGQPCDDRLLSTLDRGRSFFDDRDRDAQNISLLNEFRSEAIRLRMPWSDLPNSDGFELIARHHGLPSPILDWTQSPFLAAFFAFDQPYKSSDSFSVVYVIDRTRIPRATLDSREVEIIDDINLLRYNDRALRQRGLFLRVSSVNRSLEDSLGESLYKFVLPQKDASIALAELDEMNVNRTILFADADSAASTAANRVLIQE